MVLVSRGLKFVVDLLRILLFIWIWLGESNDNNSMSATLHIVCRLETSTTFQVSVLAPCVCPRMTVSSIYLVYFGHLIFRIHVGYMFWSSSLEAFVDFVLAT